MMVQIFMMVRLDQYPQFRMANGGESIPQRTTEVMDNTP